MGNQQLGQPHRNQNRDQDESECTRDFGPQTGRERKSEDERDRQKPKRAPGEQDGDAEFGPDEVADRPNRSDSDDRSAR